MCVPLHTITQCVKVPDDPTRGQSIRKPSLGSSRCVSYRRILYRYYRISPAIPEFFGASDPKTLRSEPELVIQKSTTIECEPALRKISSSCKLRCRRIKYYPMIQAAASAQDFLQRQIELLTNQVWHSRLLDID